MARKQNKIYKTESGELVHAVMAEFATPADLYHACEKVRDAGYRVWDAYSPFPVHGLDEAMGLTKSRLPLIVGIMGITGAGVGFAFQYWVTNFGYRLVVQGKPTEAWESLAPVTFEFGVIFTAFTAILGMLALNRLPMWHHPLMKKDRFLRCSDDRMVIAIEAKDPKFDPMQTRKLLESAKGYNIDLVEE